VGGGKGGEETVFPILIQLLHTGPLLEGALMRHCGHARLEAVIITGNTLSTSSGTRGGGLPIIPGTLPYAYRTGRGWGLGWRDKSGPRSLGLKV
jgi:hypothetical protein